MLHATCTEIDKLQIFFCSQVYMFVRHGGVVGFSVPWPLKAVLQIIYLFQRYHTLGDEVPFLIISPNLQRLLVHIFVNPYVFEDIRVGHEMKYLLIIVKNT